MVTTTPGWAIAVLAIAGGALTLQHPGTATADRSVAAFTSHAALGAPRAAGDEADPPFLTSDRCLACHQGVSTARGLDVSIGLDWRASMMANSARDPYWQAAVRREITDYPQAAGAIEAKCSRCHMPMASVVAAASGGQGAVFANLPVGQSAAPDAALAADGVSCAACHRIEPEGLGTEASYTGGFTVSTEPVPDGRPVYGPFAPDSGGVGIMHSATGFRPTEAAHVQSSELCASCHTLFTHSIRPDGSEGPEFPEQVPYLEWQASAYAAQGTSCQDCHMPLVGEDVPVTRVLGRARPDVSRHVFRGGNFFMLRMLNRYRAQLGVAALPQELSLTADRTEEHLRQATASLTIVEAAVRDGRVEATLEVRNRAGHKFPTAYPSRRAWIRLTVADASGRVVFESGAFAADGSIAGNDADADPARYEPHHETITSPDQVQIYEGVMLDREGRVTTGLMSAERWAKENRLLPDGFDATAGGPRTATVGGATSDADFTAGSDRVRYSIPARGGAPFTVRAELWFQPVAYRWAENLAAYDAPETIRFVGWYREMASASAIPIASASAEVR